MDESIFIDDSLVRRKMWTADRIRPIITITGSHQRTCVFGALSMIVGIRWKWQSLDSVSVNAPLGGNDWLAIILQAEIS